MAWDCCCWRLSEETVETLNGHVKGVLERTAADGELHDVSIYISGASTGLTLHSSTLRPPKSAQRLAGHCDVRKYLQKAERWFGVALRPDGTVVLVVEMMGEWKRDMDMERIVVELPLRAAEEIQDGSKRWRK